LKASIKLKNKLYLKRDKYPSKYNIDNYKHYRNKLHSILCFVEREHFCNLVNQNKTNLRKAWSIIKYVINRNTRSSSPSSNKFVINNNITNNNNEIVQHFNDFFVNIGPSLAKKIPIVNKDPMSYVKCNMLNSMYLSDVSHNELTNVIKSLKLSSPGYDDIQAKIVKKSFQCYSQSLLYILNLIVFISRCFSRRIKNGKSRSNLQK
jgi:hypothetical protein